MNRKNKAWERQRRLPLKFHPTGSSLLSALSAFLLFILLLPSLSIAAEPLPFNTHLKNHIRDTFYSDTPDQLSREKILRYRAGISRRYMEVKSNLKNYYLEKLHLSKDKSKKKIKGKGEIRTFKILLHYIDQLQQCSQLPSPHPPEAQKLALKILELDYALKKEGKKLPSAMLFEKVPASLKPWKIPLHRAEEGEASNLYNPKTGLFYSQAELAKMKCRGDDVSSLNPPPDSTFWINHPVSRIDINAHYLGGKSPLHKGIEFVFPSNKAYFKKIRRTQTKPKMDVKSRHSSGSLTFKLKVGAEVHSEITCAALYSALGFSADVSRYVRDFKVVLGEMTPLEFKRQWESYYSRYPLKRLVKTQGRDEEGHFVIFHEGVLEAKPEELLRVGPWAYGQNGHRGLREVRSSIIFNMWVSNLDLKEAENNKLILRKMGEKYRFFHIQHDMGFAFGGSYIERPGEFSWNLVKKRTEHHIRMYYRCFQKNSGFKHVTYSDARWMVRLIARLTRKQIDDAVALGGWPLPLRQLLVEKLISRRNQMVEAFKLVGEKTPEGDTISLLKFDRHLTTPDGAVVNGKLKTYNFPGYPQYFGPRINELILLVIKGLRNLAVDGAVQVAGSVKYITIEPEWFGLDRNLVTQVILRIDREIESNPTPRNESDSFLVKDSMQLGFRLGYGYVVSGEVTYKRKYTLVYPVATRNQARFHNGFVLNLMLPYHARKKRLPDNYVLISEDYLEGRGRLRVRGHDMLFKPYLTASQVYLKRYFLSRKNQESVVFFQDNSIYKELGARLYFELFELFRFSLFKATFQKGTLKRELVEMDIKDLERNGEKIKALDNLLWKGDPSLIRKLGSQRSLHDRFTQKLSRLTLFGLYKRRSVYRIDKVKENTVCNGAPILESDALHHFQVESRKLKSWRFVDNGERHFSSVRLSGKTDGHKQLTSPLVKISLQVNDKATSDKELKKGYLHFINTLALRKNFIDFDPSRHTVNGIWGYIQLFVDIVLYEEAVERLLQIEEQEVWDALAEVTARPVDFWLKKSRAVGYRKPFPRSYSRAGYLATKTRYFIRTLRKARKAKGSLKKMRLLVKALRKSIYSAQYTYSPILLAVIHKLVGKKNLYLSATITMPENKENVLPVRTPLYNEIGRDRGLHGPEFHFIFNDPIEIYHLFE